tara:strand:- start:2557 stop:4017 length:1461 start_codon:yes stop_codon:yes gene_type:complete
MAAPFAQCNVAALADLRRAPGAGGADGGPLDQLLERAALAGDASLQLLPGAVGAGAVGAGAADVSGSDTTVEEDDDQSSGGSTQPGQVTEPWPQQLAAAPGAAGAAGAGAAGHAESERDESAAGGALASDDDEEVVRKTVAAILAKPPSTTELARKRKVGQLRFDREDWAEAAGRMAGWRAKKPECWRGVPKDTMVDFSFENPMESCLWDLPAMADMMTSFPGRVVRLDTSYCHYDFAYRKRTSFVTTVKKFSPPPPCPRAPCAHYRQNGSHRSGVLGLGVRQKNSIPTRLLREMLRAWMLQNSGAIEYTVIDMFAGYGSLDSAIKDAKADINIDEEIDPCDEDKLAFWADRWSRVRYFGNDVSASARCSSFRPNADFDVNHILEPGALTGLGHLVKMALSATEMGVCEQKRLDADPLAYCRGDRSAVLFHCSTPCSTYSLNARAHHRDEELGPTTETAASHDVMNETLIRAFIERILRPRAARGE